MSFQHSHIYISDQEDTSKVEYKSKLDKNAISLLFVGINTYDYTVLAACDIT